MLRIALNVILFYFVGNYVNFHSTLGVQRITAPKSGKTWPKHKKSKITTVKGLFKANETTFWKTPNVEICSMTGHNCRIHPSSHTASQNQAPSSFMPKKHIYFSELYISTQLKVHNK